MATGTIKYDGQLNELKVLHPGTTGNGYIATGTSINVTMPNLTQAVFHVMGGAQGRSGLVYVQTTSTGVVTIYPIVLGSAITFTANGNNNLTIANATGSGGGTYVHVLCFNGNVTLVS